MSGPATAELVVRSPFDGREVCRLPCEGVAGAALKLERAAAVQQSWRGLSVVERVRAVSTALSYFRRSGEEVARDVTRQMGKPIRESRREVESMLARAEHLLAIAERSLAPVVLPAPDGFHLRIEHEPLGVVLDVAAWNYPLLIAVNVVVPALLAGNTVLLKHSAKTPLVGLHFERAFAALPLAGLLSNLILTHAEVEQLIADPRVGYVAFTGSVEGGRAIYGACARRFIDAGLELGGKDPAYVAEDADLDFSTDNVVDGSCYNAGQSCCAVERAYVHRSLYRPFLERAERVMRAYELGDPLDESTTMGPLANREALDFLEEQVADAVRRGARLLLGGRRLQGTAGNFFPPTLLAECPNDALVMQEESFGPILPVHAVANDDEALARMNECRYGLTASVWTKSRQRAERFAHELEAGTVYQNRCDYLDPALPWTGVKDSGKGSTLSSFGFLQLTRRKSIHFRA